MDYNSIAVELIYNYLNNPSKYTKLYIIENFNLAITVLEESLKSYFQQNQSITSYKLGGKSITYKDLSLNKLVSNRKELLPSPKSKKAVVLF